MLTAAAGTGSSTLHENRMCGRAGGNVHGRDSHTHVTPNVSPVYKHAQCSSSLQLDLLHLSVAVVPFGMPVTGIQCAKGRESYCLRNVHATPVRDTCSAGP